MSNDPRPAKPPLPLLKHRKSSGTVPATRLDASDSAGAERKASETGRSGTIAAVRPPPVLGAPRPTNVLRRLDPTFTPDAGADAWEPKGTFVGGSYRDSMPTVPSPEVLEARLLAELAAGEVKAVESPEPDPLKPGARAHFEPAHAPAVRVSPIIELEKAAAVIVDPHAIVSRTPVPSRGLEPEEVPLPSTVRVPAALALLDQPTPVATDAMPAERDADEVFEDPLGSAGDDSELVPEPTERSRITMPPARRRRSRRTLRGLLVGVVLLGGLGGAGWYRYPALCEQGWQRSLAELSVWRGALEHHWSLGMRALGR